MRITQRQAVIGVFSLLIVGALAFIVQAFFQGFSPMIWLSVAAIPLFGGLLAGYLRGWHYATYVMVILLTLMIGFGLSEPYVTQEAASVILLAPIIALLFANPLWVLGTSLLLMVILISRGGVESAYLQPIQLITGAMAVTGLILSRLITNTAQQAAEESAQRAEAALSEAETRAAELSAKAAELTRKNEEQSRLIDLVATLETPSVALADGVIFSPVVGHLDSRRAANLTERLLKDVAASRARLVVLDVAGVAAIDTAVAQSLLRSVQAVRLLGCDVTITGISAGIAATMTELGISMTGVQTARTPQEALSLMPTMLNLSNGARKNSSGSY